MLIISRMCLKATTGTAFRNQLRWRTTKTPVTSRKNYGFDSDANEKIDVNTEQENVLSFMTNEEFEKRKQLLEDLKIFRGPHDLDTVKDRAPVGFFLQDWAEFLKKFYYIEHNLIDWLYEKKELQVLKRHPLVDHAIIMERSFDQIRTRSIFAQRTGFKTLASLRKVENATKIIGIGEIILSDVDRYMKIVAPHCSREEYDCFVNLVSNYDLEDDDADLYEELSQMMSIKTKK